MNYLEELFAEFLQSISTDFIDNWLNELEIDIVN